jgi:hypothetical protein
MPQGCRGWLIVSLDWLQSGHLRGYPRPVTERRPGKPGQFTSINCVLMHSISLILLECKWGVYSIPVYLQAQLAPLIVMKFRKKWSTARKNIYSLIFKSKFDPHRETKKCKFCRGHWIAQENYYLHGIWICYWQEFSFPVFLVRWPNFRCDILCYGRCMCCQCYQNLFEFCMATRGANCASSAIVHLMCLVHITCPMLLPLSFNHCCFIATYAII